MENLAEAEETLQLGPPPVLNFAQKLDKKSHLIHVALKSWARRKLRRSGGLWPMLSFSGCRAKIVALGSHSNPQV